MLILFVGSYFKIELRGQYFTILLSKLTRIISRRLSMSIRMLPTK